MKTTIRVIPHGLGLINAQENQLIRKWGNEAWGDLELCQKFEYQSGADYCVLVYSGDEFVGFAAVSKRSVKLDGVNELSMGCVGGVITDPKYRGKGYGSVMMNEVHRLIFDTLRCDFGGLLCENTVVNFYRKLGWTLNKGVALVDRDNEKTEWPEAFMYYAKSDCVVEANEVDLCGLPW